MLTSHSLSSFSKVVLKSARQQQVIRHEKKGLSFLFLLPVYIICISSTSQTKNFFVSAVSDLTQQQIQPQSVISINADIDAKFVRSDSISNITTAFPPNYKCVNFTYTGLLTPPFEICYVDEKTNQPLRGNSSLRIMNQYNYTIYDRLANHTSKLDSKAIIKVGVGKTSDRDVKTASSWSSFATYIQVFDIAHCKRRRYCGQDKYSADCTNLLFGRNVNCEPLIPLFFPFTEDAITSGIRVYELTKAPTTAPVSMEPTAAPVSTALTESPTLLRPKMLPIVMSIIPSYIPSSIVPSFVPSYEGPPNMKGSIIPSSYPSEISTAKPQVRYNISASPMAVPSRLPVSGSMTPSRGPSKIVSSTSSPTIYVNPDTEGITCVNFTYVGRNLSFPVCYVATMYALGGGISIWPNGSTIAGEPIFTYSYKIHNPITNESLYSIELQRTGVADGKTAFVNQVSLLPFNDVCKSYKYCGNDTYSADCTNLLYGRKVICESNEPIFFPFTEQATTKAVRVKFPSNLTSIKPVSLPTARPTTRLATRPTTRPTTRYDNNDGNTIRCMNNFTYQRIPRARSFQICHKTMAHAMKETTFFLDGTERDEIQRYSYNYTLFSRNREDKRQVLFTISAGRTSILFFNNGTTLNKGASVKVNGVGNCKWANYCGQNKLSADCTNLLFGRKVKCESVFPLFFPFEEDALKSKISIRIKPPARTPARKSSSLPAGITCTNSTYVSSTQGKNVSTFGLCFSIEQTGLGGGASLFQNGTTIVGEPSYTTTYKIYNPNKRDQFKTIVYNISMTRVGTTCKSMTVNDQKCASCEYCDNLSKPGYRFNCLNLPNGRKSFGDNCKVPVEVSEGELVFPLKHGALAQFNEMTEMQSLRQKIIGPVRAVTIQMREIFKSLTFQ